MRDLRQTRRPVRAPAEPCGAAELGYGRHQHDLLQQADVARALGSRFVAQVLVAASQQLWRAPRTAALIANWPGDRAAAAVAMRLNAALHALARQRVLPELTALYVRQEGDFDQVIGEALAAGDETILAWMERPTQTNEVGRAAAIWSALMVAHCQMGLPFALLELGASSGLNLNMARYAYRLGESAAGESRSGVEICPLWRGASPVIAPVQIHAARGVDLHPLDPTDDAAHERLMSYVWADDPARSARLEQALAIARQYPPQVDCGDAAQWLAGQLQAPQAKGVCRVVYHSMVLQYLDEAAQQRLRGHIWAAGRAASAARPFAWISFEWDRARSEVQLLLTCWPDGETRQLATCHPYGAWIDWHGGA